MENTNRGTTMALGGIASLVAVGMGVRYIIRSNRLTHRDSPGSTLVEREENKQQLQTKQQQASRNAESSSAPLATISSNSINSNSRPPPPRRTGGTISPIVKTGYLPMISNPGEAAACPCESTEPSSLGIVSLVVDSEGDDDDDELEVGSYVHVANMEDAFNHSLWNAEDNKFCGRFGFVRRVDTDGDIQVAFSDSTSVVCDKRFIVLDEAPAKTVMQMSGGSVTSSSSNHSHQYHHGNGSSGRKPSIQGLSNASASTSGRGLSKMASSFREMNM